MLRVFLVSDSLLFSTSLKNLLNPEIEIEIVGEGRSVDQALTEIEALRPDVVIYGNTGLSSDTVQEEIHLLKSTPPGVKLISLSLQDNEMFIYQLDHQMVQGPNDLIRAITANLS